MGARTIRAWLRDHECERRTGNRTKPSGLPCSTGRRRHGLASCPSAAGAYPRLKSRAPIVPAPGACRRLQRSLPASTGRQRGSEKRSANRLRTRCGRAYNRYGCKCQDHSPSLHQPTVAPHLMRDSAFLQALRFRKAAGPRVKHGETAGMGWFRDWQVPDRESGNRTFALWRRLARSGLTAPGGGEGIADVRPSQLRECNRTGNRVSRINSRLSRWLAPLIRPVRLRWTFLNGARYSFAGE